MYKYRFDSSEIKLTLYRGESSISIRSTSNFNIRIISSDLFRLIRSSIK